MGRAIHLAPHLRLRHIDHRTIDVPGRKSHAPAPWRPQQPRGNGSSGLDLSSDPSQGRRSAAWALTGAMVPLSPQNGDGGEIGYTEYKKALAEGRVKSLTIDDTHMSGVIVLPDSKTQKEFRFLKPRDSAELTIAEAAAEQGVDIEFETAPFWLSPWFYIPLIVTAFLLARKAAKNHDALVEGESVDVTMDDVAGVPEVKREVLSAIEFLRKPERFARLGAEPPAGILLTGGPGVGKTLMAKAVAGSANVPFYSISGSDFVEMLAGLGASRVRELFKAARETGGVVFIDEIDAVGKKRSSNPIGGDEEREQTLNAILVETDGLSSRGEDDKPVLLLGATNRPDTLDPALLRPGRFDKQIEVSPPTVEGRAEILEVHTKDKPLADEVDLEALAQDTMGFTGADLKHAMNEAATICGERGGDEITNKDISAAIDKIVAGIESHRPLSAEERKRLAYHEAGHAILEWSHGGSVSKVTIVPRSSGALGFTQRTPDRDVAILSEIELLNQLAMSLGGRTAERLAFDKVDSTGAADDLERVTETAIAMVTRYGMADELPPMAFALHGKELPVSEKLLAKIDAATTRYVKAASDHATGVLEKNRDLLDDLAAALLERETLLNGDLEEFAGQVKSSSPIVIPKAESDPAEAPQTTPSG